MAMSRSSADVGTDAAAERVEVKLISFNFGVDQQMLEETWNNKHRRTFSGIMETFFEEHEADFVCGCEVGGHKKGFDCAGISYPAFRSAQNYIAAMSPTSQVLGWDRRLDVIKLEASAITDSQLVLTAMQAKQHDGTSDASAIIVGNLHIRTPNKEKKPTLTTKQRLVQESIGHVGKLSEK